MSADGFEPHEAPPDGAGEEAASGPVSWSRVLSFGFVLALLGLLAWGLVRVQAGPRSDGPAPDFTLTTFDGRTVVLSELRGQVVVINFWASWCPPCRDEAPYLEATWRKYQDRGVVFIGVDYVDTEAEALAYIEEFEITYPNGPDLGTRISQAFRIRGVPETYIVGSDGRVASVKIGPYTSLNELSAQIEGALAP